MSLGFSTYKADPSLFIYRHGADTVYLLLYVDDIVLTASLLALLRQVINSLHSEFSLKDLGDLHFFLGVSVQRIGLGFFLSQCQYTEDILTRSCMTNCNPCSTPVDTSSKLPSTDEPVANATDYRSIAGALQYLTFTRPNIAYAVQQACLHMYDPRELHANLHKCILRYLKGTINYGLQLHWTSPTSITAYTDADWAGCSTPASPLRVTTSFLAITSFCGLPSDSSQSRSSAEAEYRAIVNAVAESCWLRQLLAELHRPLQQATIVFCDNISAVYSRLIPSSTNGQNMSRLTFTLFGNTSLGEVRVLHVPTTSQYADVFTKGFPTAIFKEFRSSLHVRPAPVPTAGGC